MMREKKLIGGRFGLSVYWIIFFLFSFIAGMVAWALILPLGFGMIMEVRDARKIKSSRRSKSTKTTIRQKIKSVLEMIFLYGLMMTILVWSLYVVIPAWMDLPRVITGDREEVTGVLDFMMESPSQSTRSWGYPYYLSVEDAPFQSTVWIPVAEGKEITIKYLPNIKVVTGYELR